MKRGHGTVRSLTCRWDFHPRPVRHQPRANSILRECSLDFIQRPGQGLFYLPW